MKKLNRKGYMTIEIILASVITFVIAFFLIDLTMSLTDVTDDAYEDAVLVTDKTLIIKNLRENIENDMCSNGGINTASCSSTTCTIIMNTGLIRKISTSGNRVSYTDGGASTIYSKKIDETFSNISLSGTNSSDYYNFKITGKNIFLDENYDINVIVYNKTSC